ncbi:scavenger receptor class F member 2-like [Saccostrea cucullata]|uniref:scavenger receptor class F member 2-like n=1 Tax=Saccostrea cuccullata TaxID=36930 RepID=UPI002ED07B72
MAEAGRQEVWFSDCNANFQKVGDVCIECPPGYFGRECKQSCPPPTYGSLCGEICDCAPSECDPTYGCPDKEKGANGCSQGLLMDANQGCCYNYQKINNTCQESSLSIKRTTEIIDIVPNQTGELNNSNAFKDFTLRPANAYHSKTAVIVSVGTGIICMLIFYIIYEIRICRRQCVPKITPRECDTI